MPKLKTHRGARKRFKLTGTGKVKRSGAKRRHILTKYSRKAKRQMKGNLIAAPGDARKIKRMLIGN